MNHAFVLVLSRSGVPIVTDAPTTENEAALFAAVKVVTSNSLLKKTLKYVIVDPLGNLVTSVPFGFSAIMRSITTRVSKGTEGLC